MHIHKPEDRWSRIAHLIALVTGHIVGQCESRGPFEPRRMVSEKMFEGIPRSSDFCYENIFNFMHIQSSDPRGLNLLAIWPY